MKCQSFGNVYKRLCCSGVVLDSICLKKKKGIDYRQLGGYFNPGLSDTSIVSFLTFPKRSNRWHANPRSCEEGRDAGVALVENGQFAKAKDVAE